MADFIPSGIGVKFGIVGNVVAPAEDKFDGKFTELRIAVEHGYKDAQTDEWKKTGTTFLTYAASGDWATELHKAETGDRVQISGNWSISTRTYEKKAGGEGIAIEARYGDFAIIDRKADRPAKTAPSGDGFTPEDAGGFV